MPESSRYGDPASIDKAPLSGTSRVGSAHQNGVYAQRPAIPAIGGQSPPYGLSVGTKPSSTFTAADSDSTRKQSAINNTVL